MGMYRARDFLCKGIDICRFKRSLDNIDTLLYMKLSRFAVLQSVIIVYTIGDIAALLCLQNQCAAFDGMYASRIDLEEISLMYRHFADEIAPLMIADHFLHFCLVFCIVSDNNFCTRFAVQHVPALGLSKRSILMLSCISIIWMNLDAQIIFCINDLDQQRNLASRVISENFRLLFPELT